MEGLSRTITHDSPSADLHPDPPPKTPPPPTPEDEEDAALQGLRAAAPGASDALLRKFLRFRRGDPRRARARLEEHAALRRAAPWLDAPAPLRVAADPALRRVLEGGLVTCPAGMRDRRGRPAVYVRYRLNHPGDGRSAADVCRAALYTLEALLAEGGAGGAAAAAAMDEGVVGVYDLRGAGAGRFAGGALGRRPPPGALRCLAGATLPLRLAGFYFLGAPAAARALWAAGGARLLVPSAKLRARVRLLRGPAELAEFFEAAALPAELGGTLPAHDQPAWVARCAAAEEAGEEEGRFFDEVLRPAPATAAEGGG